VDALVRQESANGHVTNDVYSLPGMGKGKQEVNVNTNVSDSFDLCFDRNLLPTVVEICIIHVLNKLWRIYSFTQTRLR
jgi:hypothetical protein